MIFLNKKIEEGLQNEYNGRVLFAFVKLLKKFGLLLSLKMLMMLKSGQRIHAGTFVKYFITYSFGWLGSNFY